MFHLESTNNCQHHKAADKAPLEPCTMVIFGISGDLAHRKLVPALYALAAEQRLPENFRILGFARSNKAINELREGLLKGIESFSRKQPVDDQLWQLLANGVEYLQGGYDDLAAFQQLRERLYTEDQERNVLYYLATPSGVYQPIIENLGKAGLVRGTNEKSWSRILIEKPFGRDLASAQELNVFVNGVFDESQVYRIDHYLGKETVQNILIFRFANAIFEPLWNRNHINHVQITAAESIDIGGRAGFYDQAGVIRDFVQNHLLEVMALCAMEQPVAFQAGPVRDEKVKVLRSLRPLLGQDIADSVVAAQYDGYRETEGVAPDSRTPTYTAMKVMIDNWRWQGVPFYLRAGKNLADRVTEVAFHFHSVPLCLLGNQHACQRLKPNVLTLRLQPNEGIGLRFGCKVPGEELDVSHVYMDFDYAQGFGKSVAPDAYERLLLDALRGDATLFARRDEIEYAWSFVTPILEAIENDQSLPIVNYAPGSTGPKEADELIRRDKHNWDPLASSRGSSNGSDACG